MDPRASIVIAGFYLVCALLCFLKGKPGFGSLGIVGMIPALAPIGVVAVVGAFRYAKPDSYWARTRYGPQQMMIARDRFPIVVRPPTAHEPSSSSMDNAPPPVGGVNSPPEVASLPDEETDYGVVLRFLDGAAKAGILDIRTHLRLVDFLQRGDARPVESTLVQGATAEAEAPPIPEPPIAPPGAVREVVSAVTSPHQPAPEPRSPSTPPPPDPVILFFTRTWDALASDIALHGFAYLGVVLTFIGVLGFLLFAFADLPDVAQPFVELFIALIFFGWAWMLRRQNADRVADGMELTGGMVLPLILFAGLVDGAPFPPDFTGRGLVVALTASSLTVGAVYVWVSSRSPRSTLRFLVGPVVWLGALTLGFAFKADEPLFSDAITRLVSPQPALASVAVALTLVACLLRREHRLATPVVKASMIGGPVAYLLTVALAVGEDWSRVWPMVVVGVSTLVSAEVLAVWHDRPSWIALARPFLIAGVLVPLAPSLGVAWTGLIVVISYLVLYDVEGRREAQPTPATWLSLIGALVGLVMSLDQPIATLIAFTLATVWSHLRRRQVESGSLAQAFTSSAALLPIGILYALSELIGVGWTWLSMAAVVAALTLILRVLRDEEVFWAYWLLGANLVIGLGATAHWESSSMDQGLAAVTLLLTSASLGLGERWPAARVWLSAAAGAGGLALGLGQLGIGLAARQLTWALVGLAAIIAANLWRRGVAGHVAAIGHLVLLLNLVSLAVGGEPHLLLSAWALGWMVSAAGDQAGGETLTGLVSRAVRSATVSPISAAVVRWLVPVAAIASVPPALIANANLWPEFVGHRSWTGALMASIGVVYAVTARRKGLRSQLRRTLGLGAVTASVIGVSVAAPDAWPTIYAAGAVVAVAGSLTRDLRQAWFVWFAWMMTVAIALLLADRAGLPGDSLHLVGLVYGGVMLIGGLVVDDVGSGRRARGEGLRTAWLRYPVVLGALTVPVGLGPVFVEDPAVYGWWVLGASVAYFTVAILLRAGGAAAPGYALAALGLTVLSPWPLVEDPWRLIFLAAPLVAISWLSQRRQHESATRWLRWDIAPLVVAHGIAAVAFVFALADGGLSTTSLAFGALSVAIGLWRRRRVWGDAGNLLVVLAGWDLGLGWLTLALVATSLRGVLGVARFGEKSRRSNQAIAVLGAGLGWPSFLVWSQIGQLESANYSILVFGALTLGVSALGRWWRLRGDTTYWWGGLGVVGAMAAALGALAPNGPGIEGPWFAIGVLMTAGALEVGWTFTHYNSRFVAVAVVGIAWVALLVGMGWDTAANAIWTAVVFGLLTLAVPETARARDRSSDGVESDPRTLNLIRSWSALGAAGVVAATWLAYDSGVVQTTGYWAAASLGVLSVASARGASPLRAGILREGSSLAALASLLTLEYSVGFSDSAMVISVVVAAAASTLGSLRVWRMRPDSSWVRPLVVLATASNVLAAALAIGRLPARPLLIAVLLSVGVQVLAVGLIRELPAVLTLGPPLIGTAFVLMISESVAGSAQWYSVPLGLVLLAEVEILRLMPRFSDAQRERTLPLEWIGLGILAGPALVEMFTVSLFVGLTALGVAVAVFIWGVATKMRRRVIASAALAIATLILLVFAAAAGSAPETAFFWIVAVGIGFAVMLVAGFVEAYRSKKGRSMERLDQLMEGWK